MQRRILALALVVVGCACRREPVPEAAKSTPTPASEAKAPEAEKPPHAIATLLQVELVDAGAEPRSIRRFVPRPGSHDASLVDVRSELTVSSPDGPLEQRGPRWQMLVELKPEQTRADGAHVLSFAIGMPTSLGKPLDEVAKGTLVVTDRGLPVSIELPDETSGTPMPLHVGEMDRELGTGLLPELQPLVDLRTLYAVQLQLVPWPEEAIGVGAKWRAVERHERPAREIRTTEYELVAQHGELAEIRATIAYATSGDPAAPQRRMSMRGERRISIASDQLLPAHETVTSSDFDLVGTPTRRRQVTRGTPIGRIDIALVRVADDAPVDGLEVERSTPCTDLAGGRSGPFPPPDTSGPALVHGTCDAGHPTGEWKALHDDGARPRLAGSFARGLPTGRWTQWNAEGKELGSFELDAEGNGTVVEWWPDGTTRLVAAFERGQPSGPFVLNHRSGTPRIRGTFESGLRNGRWDQLDEAGKIVGSETLDARCLVVKSVDAGSVAADAGVANGDLIVEVGGEPVRLRTDLTEALQKLAGAPLTLAVERGSETVVLSTTRTLAADDPKLGILLRCKTALE